MNFWGGTHHVGSWNICGKWFLTNIITVIISRKMRWVGHVAHTEQMGNSYKTLVRKPECKIPLEKPRWMILSWNRPQPPPSKSSKWAPRHEGVLGEWRYNSTHSSTSALDGGEWSTSCPSCFTPQGKTPWYPLDRRLDGPQSCSGHSGKEKNSQPPPHLLKIQIIIASHLMLFNPCRWMI